MDYEKLTKVIFAKGNNVESAISINDNEVNEISDRMPRLFCKFPLIGTELHKIPIIINSPDFEVGQERGELQLDSRVNKQRIDDGINLYIKILKYLEEQKFEGIYNICEHIGNIDFLDHEKNTKIKEIIEKLKIIDCFGRKSLQSYRSKELNTIIVDFIDDERWELISKLRGLKPIPNKKTWSKWSKVYSPWKSVEELLNIWVFTEIKEKQLKVLGNSDNLLSFLNDFYKVEFNKENKSIYSIQDKIFLNQNDTFIDKENIYIDDNINEELKNLAESFSVDIRNNLLNKNIISENLNLKKKDDKDLALSIDIKVKNLLEEAVFVKRVVV